MSETKEVSEAEIRAVVVQDVMTRARISLDNIDNELRSLLDRVTKLEAVAEAAKGLGQATLTSEKFGRSLRDVFSALYELDGYRIRRDLDDLPEQPGRRNG